jgi:hypothetical protein
MGRMLRLHVICSVNARMGISILQFSGPAD